jgi:hypothetical protein
VSSVTGGPAWTSVATVLFNTIATPTQRLTLFRAVPSVDYTGTLTIAFANTQTGAAWDITETFGVDTTTTQGVRQSATNQSDSATTLTATLGAFGATANATYGATAKGSTGGVTPGSGFTELADVNAATPAQALETEWRNDNDTSVDQSWSGATAAAVIAVELVAGTGIAAYAGDVDAPILAQLWGPATIMRLTNVSTGEALEVATTVDADQYLEIDTSPGVKSITLVDSVTLVETNAMAGLNLAVARLWSLRPGNNTIHLDVTGGSGNSHAVIAWRTRYSSI